MTHPPLVPLKITHTDDPRVVQDAATEDYTTHAVPPSWRSSKASLSMSWYALVSGMFYLVTAATLAAVVGTTDALIGIGLACVVFGVFGFVFSRFAARTGLTVALMSQRVLGAAGSTLACLILAATAMYYAVFESSMIAGAFHTYFGGLPLPAWSAIAVAMNLPLVMGSIRRWMDKYNAVLLPVYWVGLIVVVVVVATNADASAWLSHGPTTPIDLAAPGWLYAFFVYLGILVFIMYTVDFARFGKRRDARFNGVVVFGPVFYVAVLLLNGLIGIFIAYASGLAGAISSEMIGNTIVSLLGGWGLFLVWVTQARINTANFYVASTNIEAVFLRVFRVRLRRVYAVLICGALTYIFMLSDVISYLFVALAWQGAFVASWVGIVLVYIVRHWADPEIEFRTGRLVRIGRGAWVWIATSVCGVLLYQFGGSFGATWSTPLTLLAGAIAYAVVSGGEETATLLRRRTDLREEVEDPWEDRVQCHVCEKHYIAVEMDRDPSAEGQPAICASCGSTSQTYRAAAYAEHKDLIGLAESRAS